jgi:hypothetical protein
LQSSPFFAESKRIESSAGVAARADFLRGVLARLIDAGRPRIERTRYPPAVHQRTHAEFDRIERQLVRAAHDHLDLESQSLRCDFRIAGFGRIPIGVEHLELGGVPRRLAWSGGLAQSGRVLTAFVRAGGWKPYYVAHLATGIKPWAFLMAYNPETQISWQRVAADCLRLNPHVRGVLATSWWYDPRVAEVAPHLAFLRANSLAHGAVSLRAGEHDNARKHALANSPERQALHSAGKYVPENYGMLWTRKALLDWADQS